MKNEGKKFEEDIKDSIIDNPHVWFSRIEDSATSFNGGSKSRFTTKSRYDCNMWDSRNGTLYGFELKSTKGTSIAFADIASVAQYKLAESDLKEYRKSIKGKQTEQQKAEIDRMKGLLKKLEIAVKSPSIKWHQIEALSADSKKGLICGFLMNFRGKDDKSPSKTYYVPVEGFLEFWKDTDKKSINEKDIKAITGSLEVCGALKTKRMTYDIEKLLIILYGSKNG